MKIDLFENKYSPSRFSKIIFMDIICFLLAISMAFGVCYSYFSDKVGAQGATALTSLNIDYRVQADDPSTSSNVVYGSINDGAEGFITAGTVINPGDTLNIRGYAVNTSNKIDIYAMTRVEIVTNKDREVLWFGQTAQDQLFMEKGMFNGIAYAIDAGESNAINIDYVFDGDKYTNQHIIQSITLTLHAHQKDYLTSASDYQDYAPFDMSGENMRGEVNEAVYATHQIIGRKRSLYNESDLEVDGLGLNHLTRDSAGNYLINSCKDWMILARNCNAGNDYCNGMTFKLNAYLDFNYMNNETSSRTMMKTIDTFKGVLDGNGYTISRWFDTNGLVYNCYGNISNLGMESFAIMNMNATEEVDGINHSAKQYVGSFVAIMSNGTIENCFAIDQCIIENEMGTGGGLYSFYEGEEHAMGTLVGLMRADSGKTATMRNCYAMSYLEYLGSSSGVHLGGLVGKTEGEISIDNVYFRGGVTITSQDYKLGLISNAHTDTSITNSWAYDVAGDFTATHESIISGSECEINNCLATNATEFTKVGDNQTDVTINTLDQLNDLGVLHNAFGWEFDDWRKGPTTLAFPQLRVFYDF